MTAPHNLGWISNDNMALLTDLYEFTMAYSYFRSGKNEHATFELFVRELPQDRSFLVSAGLEQILYYLENISFGEESLDYLGTLGLFDTEFLDYLGSFKFTGTVYAIPEGEIYFPPEPVIMVSAPRIEAQIVETFLLNTFNFQSLVASKAARIVLAADGRGVVDFSLRRDHGADAAVKAARASYIAGCLGTSNVLAGMFFDIPVFGTMAHSYVMSFVSEIEAFRRFVKDYPKNSVLLIDTYDTIGGAKNAIKVGKEMKKAGRKLQGLRLDSGDLALLSKKVRGMLDGDGLGYVKIMASGDLNEYRIQDLVKGEAPIDTFGVGTEMGTSRDSPALGGIYKLSCDNLGPRMKLSCGKATLPGKKVLYRCMDTEGMYWKDLIATWDEKVDLPDGYKVLERVMENGSITSDVPSITVIRRRFLGNMEKIPALLKDINNPGSYSVEISENLSRKAEGHLG